MVCAVAGVLLYGLLLPYAETASISPGNWLLLGARGGTAAAVLGVLLGWAVATPCGSWRQDGAGRRGLWGALAAVLGIVPNFLCCSPVVPAVLGLLGASTAVTFGLGGRIEAFFALHEMAFWAGSAMLLLAAGVANAVAWEGNGCGETCRKQAGGHGDAGVR